MICVWRLTDRSVSVEQEMRCAGGRVFERFKDVKSRGRIGRVGSKFWWFFIEWKSKLGENEEMRKGRVGCSNQRRLLVFHFKEQFLGWDLVTG